eukprot:CCRYP_000775-RA/>CCRYP_000775-RA protein AED:0.24 eAED:0.24 QI:250/1/1/1/1/1/2/2392/748
MNGNTRKKARPPTTMAPPRRCPYATLNLPDRSHNCNNDKGAWPSSWADRVSDDEIRDAYKRLSRHLHPDKFPPGREREDAQEIFTELMNAYEILSDPVLRQAYDHFGHYAVAIVRHNRYGSSSLYRTLSALHHQGKTEQALEELSCLLENVAREKRRNQLHFDADVEVHLHLNRRGCAEWVDVAETSVGFTSSVPMLANGAAASGGSPPNSSDEYPRQPHTIMGEKMNLAIGGRTFLERGLGSTRGILSATYQPSKETYFSSDLSFGRKHFETSVSAIRNMANGTLLSAKVTRHHGDDGHLSFGFSSSRSLSLIHGRPDMNAMFALNFGLDPPTKLQLQYGYFALSTWGFWAKSTTEDDDDDDVAYDEDNVAKDDYNESDTQSNTSSSKAQRKDRVSMKNNHHPPKITAKLTLGQFPVELAIEQSHLLDSPQRSLEASIAYSPFRGTFSLKSMLSRELSPNTTCSVGLSHVGMNGLTWLFRYQRQELTLNIPIFVAHFLSPRYWNSMISLSIVSYLMDETLSEMMKSDENKEKVNAFDVHETIAVKEHIVLKEMTWMNSFNAKSSSIDQMAIMANIGRVKMEYEDAINGLVILKATYGLSQSSHSHSEKTSIDVTLALQFWVCNSRLVLPSCSKKMLLGFYDVSLQHSRYDNEQHDASILHELVDRMNALLAYFGVGHAKYQYDDGKIEMDRHGPNIEEDCPENNAPPKLTIRYRYRGNVFEIELDDDQSVSLPSQNAFMLGSSKLLC